MELVRARDTQGVRVVDSVFAFRPEWDRFWDVRIWLDVDPEASTARYLTRDSDREGAEEAARLNRER